MWCLVVFGFYLVSPRDITHRAWGTGGGCAACPALIPSRAQPRPGQDSCPHVPPEYSWTFSRRRCRQGRCFFEHLEGCGFVAGGSPKPGSAAGRDGCNWSLQRYCTGQVRGWVSLLRHLSCPWGPSSLRSQRWKGAAALYLLRVAAAAACSEITCLAQPSAPPPSPVEQ